WDPNRHEYGILPQIWGTLYSSVLALIFGTILGLAVAVFLSERFFSGFLFAILKLFGLQFHRFWGRLPDRMETLLRNLIDLLAAIPSVVYGLWAQALDKAGVHVVYGMQGLKTHAKTTLVVRNEAEGIRCYAHIGTGNYHVKTARLYTDLSL